VRAVPRLCEFYPGICLTTEEKTRKNLSQGKKDLSQGKKDLSQGKKDLSQGKKDLSQGKKDLSQGKKELYLSHSRSLRGLCHFRICTADHALSYLTWARMAARSLKG